MESGWYPDPHGAGERWHDGSRWTGVTRATAESAARVVKAKRVANRRQKRAHRRHRLRSVGGVLTALTAAVALALLISPDQIRPIAQTIGIGRPHRLLPAVTPTIHSTDYAILDTDSAHDPITYDPCRPLHYVINPTGAPADYLAFIDPAIDKAQAATGLQFVYDGDSDDTWASHRRARKAEPILLSFPTSLDSPKGHDDAVGLGGSSFLKSERRPEVGHYITGQVALLRGWFRKESGRQATALEQSVVMHELGHVLGLGHVQDAKEVMYPKAQPLTDFGAGDLAGLAKLGAGRCD